jgi:hypothetical protein
MKPFVANAANQGQVQHASALVALKRRRELEDVRQTLRDRAGRRLLWRYLDSCGIFREVFNPNNAIMAKNEGRRTMGLEILADVMEADANALVLMMRENQAEEALAAAPDEPEPGQAVTEPPPSVEKGK